MHNRWSEESKLLCISVVSVVCIIACCVQTADKGFCDETDGWMDKPLTYN